MAYRITVKMLERQLEILNELTGNPLTPYSKNAEGKYKANIGNFHLSQAYGGCCVHQMCTEGGGVNTIPRHSGHVPKRECYDNLVAFIRGIEFERDGRV
jgi:hypothetical protein